MPKPGDDETDGSLSKNEEQPKAPSESAFGVFQDSIELWSR